MTPGNRQQRQDREIVAAVLRQLVCDLCGQSGGAQQLCFRCGVSPYGAASGNRQRRQHSEIVALMPLLFLSIFFSIFAVNGSCVTYWNIWNAMFSLLRCLLSQSLGTSSRISLNHTNAPNQPRRSCARVCITQRFLLAMKEKAIAPSVPLCRAVGWSPMSFCLKG